MRFPLTAIHPCLTIFLVAVLLHPFTAMGGPRYRVFHIPSASMAPTVQLDDLVLVEVPPSWQPPIRPCDVVAYRKPAPAGAPEVDYLRRVVALPGDRVAYVSGRLRLNGVVVPREQVGTGEQVTIYRETLPSGCSYLIQEMDDYRNLENTAEVTVPPGSFFGLGDNRDNAMDSRLPMVGPIPMENVFGRAALVYWAKDRARIGQTLLPRKVVTSP